ncbi:hypothetical protein EI94DRAFT_1701204 [Lactarius quietus]|nr:hypothetical protein EI94DRAFT_1701204 [Lactarius quietus]
MRSSCAPCRAGAQTPAKGLDSGKRVHHSQAHSELLVEEFKLGTLWDEYGLVGDVTYANLSSEQQLIKGAFKDHLITWVNNYVKVEYPELEAQKILDDIDQRITLAPSFAGLRRFPEARNFKQWTGDNSKALMKVYLPAIEGHIPDQMVQAMHTFLKFCYIARRDIHDTHSIEALEDALRRFRCHLQAHQGVKEPWQRSNRFEALAQMLLINQRLDKLAASRVNFAKCGMLEGMCLSTTWEQILRTQAAADHILPHSLINQECGPTSDDSGKGEVNDDKDGDEDGNEDGKVAGPTVEASINLGKKSILNYTYKHPKSDFDTSLADLPSFYGKITVYPSAIATFYAPSDLSGMHGLSVAHVRLFFSFTHGGVQYPCALVHWLSRMGDSSDENTGMWVVEEMDDDGDECPVAILHLDTIVHAAHLLPGNLKSQYHFATAPPVPPGLLPLNPLSMNQQALKNSKTAQAGLPSQWLDGGSTFPDDRSLSSPNSSDLSSGGGSPPLPHINSPSIPPSNQGAEDEIIPTAIVIKNIPFIAKHKTLLEIIICFLNYAITIAAAAAATTTTTKLTTNNSASPALLEPMMSLKSFGVISIHNCHATSTHHLAHPLGTKPLEQSKAADRIHKHYARFKLEKKGVEIADVVPTPWHGESGKAREGGHLTVEFVRWDGTSLRRQHVYPTNKAYGCWRKSG